MKLGNPNALISFQAKDFIGKEAQSAKVKRVLQGVLSSFITELKNRDYCAHYFSRRTEQSEVRMCDGDGWFLCEGKFNADKCAYFDHLINPYGSREARILFSTWDLDHG